MVLHSKHGEERIIGFTTAPRVNTAGDMDGIIVSFRDITDVKRIQKEMERVSRLSTIAEIASAVAHEIRNPLAGIKTMAQSIEENLGETDGNKEYISRIIKQVDRLNDILKTFFTYARPAKPRITRTSLINIINEVKPLVGNKLMEKNILMIENYERGLPDILVDPNQMQQVFLNLLLNSIDAVAGKGRIEIVAKSLQPAEREAYSIVFPELKDNGDYIVLKFSDNGCGMPKETAEKIFEPFFTTKSSGSGLGLSIVYSLLHENNAAIFVDSVEGAGSTFIIFLEADRKWEKFSL
ncbi:MAG: ATP-binding protein [Nitrospirota bacterium]